MSEDGSFRIDRLRLIALALITVVAVALTGCGSVTSGDANTLLRQTFDGSHALTSGNVSFSVTLNPSGSRTLTAAIELTFGGPFQSRGQGRLPASDFTVRMTASGRTGSLAIVSTGTTGYVTIRGSSYRLPAATFEKLESSFAQVASAQGAASAGGLAKLGVDPMRWLVKPSIVGHQTVGGADTTHIRAGVDVAPLMTDLNTLLRRAASLGTTTAPISTATRSRIASAVKDPVFDVWTGTRDRTVRRLSLALTLPVAGAIATALGGISSARIAVTVQYADLGQPQSIQPPATIRPFGEFRSKLRSLLASLSATAGAP
jgi:hypothetical protein